MMRTASRERRVGRARSALDDAARRRTASAGASNRVPIVAERGGRADLERATGRERGSPKKDEPDDMRAEP